MAAGNSYGFVAYLEKVFDSGIADFGTPNTIKCALIKSLANGGFDPVVTTAYPTWGSAGTTDLSTSQVTPGGNYVDGGVTCTNPTSGSVSNVLQIDWDNPPSWPQHASNPTNARWAVFYDDTHADKPCVLWYDLGTDIDMTTGELAITMGAPAYTFTVEPSFVGAP
jgi:hypothetical protein